jgi:streptogramin lyase
MVRQNRLILWVFWCIVSQIFVPSLLSSNEPVDGDASAAVRLLLLTGAIVPDCTGLTQEAAEELIISKGFAVGTILNDYSSTISIGLVARQSLQAGMEAEMGGKINLIISLGPASGGLPPDPEEIATPNTVYAPTIFHSANEFIFSSPVPVQTGIVDNAIDPVRMAVLKGIVTTKQGGAISGVKITILDHSEFGQTLTREDGTFDIAVNGGSSLIVQYTKQGYLPIQRQVDVPNQDYVHAPDAILIIKDSKGNPINLKSSYDFQVARGNTVKDIDGRRTPTILFPKESVAQGVKSDGTKITLPDTITVRATEYTSGTSGPDAMPAPLPPTSGYTYCIELSVDEADAAGAVGVEFSNPIPVYVDNFLGFKVGTGVPIASYDEKKGVWIPVDDGRVIKIISETDGKADIDGLQVVITDAERAKLAQLYDPGQELWRATFTHFTSFDLNYGITPIVPAEAPQNPAPTGGSTSNEPDSDCSSNGSFTECTNQSIGETVPIVGTSYSLHYMSDRMPGRIDMNTLDIKLIGGTIPSKLLGVELTVQVAGKADKWSFNPPFTPSMTQLFAWDGTDVYGRTVQGMQNARIDIHYLYEGFYIYPPDVAQSFGLPKGSPSTVPSREKARLTQTFYNTLGNSPVADLAGWSITSHHVYDPGGQILYLGDGTHRRTENQNLSVIDVTAGNGIEAFSGDGGAATDASLQDPFDVATTPEGGYYIADKRNHRIRKVNANGMISTVAGTGISGFSGDGGSATNARLSSPSGVATGPDGSLYIADTANFRVRRVDVATGKISTIAGSGTEGGSGDDGPATAATLSADVRDITVSPDGAIYIADAGNHKIRRVSPSGMITTVAGTGISDGNLGEGGPAIEASLSYPMDVAVGPEGSIIIADSGRSLIRKVTPDGYIHTLVDMAKSNYAGNRIKPRSVHQWLENLSSLFALTEAHALDTPASEITIDVAGDGSVYINRSDRIWILTTDGAISPFAGGGSDWGSRVAANQAKLTDVKGIALSKEGKNLYITTQGCLVALIHSPMPAFSAQDIRIFSEDGKEIYVFNASGRHLRTLNASTENTLIEFGYDVNGRLETITDFGNITRIYRTAVGLPERIKGPSGQETVLEVGADGYLSKVIDPSGQTYAFAYGTGGLLTGFKDPVGNQHIFSYDVKGLYLNDNEE